MRSHHDLSKGGLFESTSISYFVQESFREYVLLALPDVGICGSIDLQLKDFLIVVNFKQVNPVREFC